MKWILLIGIVMVVAVFLNIRSDSKKTSQVSSSNNQPVISQSFKSSKDSAVDALTSDARFKDNLAYICRHMDLLKDLRLCNDSTVYMLKYIKKEPEFNTGAVSIYTCIGGIHPKLLQKLRNSTSGRTADERISIEDEIIRDISALSVEAFREKIDPDFLCEYLEPYANNWNDDSYELNFVIDVFMPEGSLTPYQMYEAYVRALSEIRKN